VERDEHTQQEALVFLLQRKGKPVDDAEVQVCVCGGGGCGPISYRSAIREFTPVGGNFKVYFT